MASDGYKTRVDRLLRGEFHVPDVSKLFLHLRLQPRCGGIVAEIGNFESHASERDQGITTSATEEFFSFMRFRWPYISGKPIPIDDLPPFFPAGMRGNFKRIDDRYLKKKTGLKRPKAKAALESLLARLITKPNGNLSVPSHLTREEAAMFDCVVNRITANPAFTDRDLNREFGDALVHCGLMAPRDRRHLKGVAQGISLYAASVMHTCKIILSDGTQGRLFIIPNTDGRLGVCAGYHVQSVTDPTKMLEIAIPMFSTRLDFFACCHNVEFKKPLAETEYELMDDQKLRFLI